MCDARCAAPAAAMGLRTPKTGRAEERGDQHLRDGSQRRDRRAEDDEADEGGPRRVEHAAPRVRAVEREARGHLADQRHREPTPHAIDGQPRRNRAALRAEPQHPSGAGQIAVCRILEQVPEYRLAVDADRGPLPG